MTNENWHEIEKLLARIQKRAIEIHRLQKQNAADREEIQRLERGPDLQGYDGDPQWVKRVTGLEPTEDDFIRGESKLI